MSAPLVVASAAVMLGALGCLAGRRAPVIALGAAVMLLGAPIVADPAPSLLIVALRAVGAALAAAILAAGLRGRSGGSAASALPWPALALLMAAAWTVGFGAPAAPLGSAGALALGAALALGVGGLTSFVRTGDGVARMVAALPLVVAAELAAAAFVGGASPLQQVVSAAGGIAAAAVVALLVTPGPAAPPTAAPAAAPADRP